MSIVRHVRDVALEFAGEQKTYRRNLLETDLRLSGRNCYPRTSLQPSLPQTDNPMLVAVLSGLRLRRLRHLAMHHDVFPLCVDMRLKSETNLKFISVLEGKFSQE